MADLDAALQTQKDNLQKRSGKSIEELIAIVTNSGFAKHGQIVSMLKSELKIGHGDANLIAHLATEPNNGSTADPADAWYAGPKAALRPIHDAILVFVATIGEDVEHAPKKTYVSLRRKRQFAMVGPKTKTQVELGLNFKGVAGTDRLQELKPGGMCSHRVRLSSVDEVDEELCAWIRHAYESAG